MADPAALTDPAVAAGLVAAVGAIGLTVRSRIVARRPDHTDDDRRLWFTRAAVAATERALFHDEDPENPVLDLRPPYLRTDIDLTEVHLDDRELEVRDVATQIATSRDGYGVAPEHDGDAHRNVELDLSDDAEPTIGLDVESDKETSKPSGRKT